MGSRGNPVMVGQNRTRRGFERQGCHLPELPREPPIDRMATMVGHRRAVVGAFVCRVWLSVGQEGGQTVVRYSFPY